MGAVQAERWLAGYAFRAGPPPSRPLPENERRRRYSRSGLRGLPVHLLVGETGSRSVHIPGITANPDGPRATQQVRDLVMDLGDRAGGFRFAARDRARQFTAPSDAVLAGAGTEITKIRPAARGANAGSVTLFLPGAAHEHGPLVLQG